MRSTQLLSNIGKDFSRIFFNNATSLEVLNDPNIKEPKTMSTKQLQEKLARAETFIRQDLHDTLATNRDLVALLHLVVKDFPVSQKELDIAADLMAPDELNNLPKPLQALETKPISCSEAEATNEYFSQINTNQIKGDTYDDGKTIRGLGNFDWKRTKGNLNNGTDYRNN